MLTETIETCGHTTPDGVLNLSLKVGVSNADIVVLVRVRPLVPAAEVDTNGWPAGFFDRVADSMPELRRPPRGHFEKRLADLLAGVRPANRHAEIVTGAARGAEVW